LNQQPTLQEGFEIQYALNLQPPPEISHNARLSVCSVMNKSYESSKTERHYLVDTAAMVLQDAWSRCPQTSTWQRNAM
jgi:hypothetical protein